MTEPEHITVVIADDQNLVRLGIRRLLELAPGIDVVGEATDGEEALEVCRRAKPDVLLLDLRMPRMDGLATLNELGTWEVPPAVLVLTTFDDDEAAIAALRAGAQGYLLKDVTLERLVSALRTLAAGGRLAQPALTATLMERVGANGDASPPTSVASPSPQPLTVRELDVLRLMAAGFSNREIAGALHLAEGTVKNHVSSILLKLDTRDRTRAVLRALEFGLVQS